MGYAALHLSPSELESIARGLFQVSDAKGTKKSELIGLCPNHDDKTPSFSYNYEKDLCGCFACGFGGDIIKLWCLVHGHSDQKEGFKAFCQQHNISDGFSTSKTPRKKEIPHLDEAFSELGALPGKWVDKLIQTRGWSAFAMDWLKIRQQTHYQKKGTNKIISIKKPERIAIPIYDKAGKVRNIRLYKPGAKKNKIISWGVMYGEARLFPPSPREKETVLLCEGESDTICAVSNGFNAITQTTKPKKWSKEQLKEFQGRDVVIAFDADQPGRMYATQYAGPEIYKVAKSVRILEWPDYMGRRDDGLWPENHGQDLTDFFVRHKKTTVDLQRLLDDAPHFKVPEPEVQAQAMEFFERGINDRLSFKPRLLAERILEKYRLLYCPDTGLLYRYNGRYWEEYFEDHLKSVALKMLGNEAKQAWVQDAVFQVKSLSTIPHGRALNDETDFVCVKNGMLNIIRGVVEDHNPDFFATYELGVTYNPESEDKCVRFIQYLQETIQTPQVIAQVQEFFGYCFLRKMPFAKCLLLLGPGSDGKSTLLNLLREMIGPENCASVSFNEMEDQFLRSSLYQKTVNISTEVGSKAVESPYFKAITSGDPVNAAFKHKNTFTFTPYCKLIFAANKMPRVLDNSDGFYRRILPVKFKRQFLEGDPDTDPFLEEKLLAEKSEIFHWALAGLSRLMRNKKFTSCDETQDLMMEYKRLNNPVVCFIEDCCVLDESSDAKKADVFKRYENYCRDGGYRSYSRENFWRELYAAHNTLKTTRPRKNNPGRETFLKGLRLKIDTEGS